MKITVHFENDEISTIATMANNLYSGIGDKLIERTSHTTVVDYGEHARFAQEGNDFRFECSSILFNFVANKIAPIVDMIKAIGYIMADLCCETTRKLFFKKHPITTIDGKVKEDNKNKTGSSEEMMYNV